MRHETFSSPRRVWKNLLQRVLNEKLQRFDVEEVERFQRVFLSKRLIFPTKEPKENIVTFERSVFQFENIEKQKSKVEILPSFANFLWSMKISAIDQRDSIKSSGQKRVTSSFSSFLFFSFLFVELSERFRSVVPPNRSLTFSSTSLTSPFRRRASSLQNQRQSDEFRQLIRQTLRNNVYPVESLNDFQRFSVRRSISYGFGFGSTRTPTTNPTDGQSVGIAPAEQTIISPNYRLPSNKIDLDINEEHFIRRAGSLKRKSVSD